MKSTESTYLTALYFRRELLFYRDAYQNKSIGLFDFFMKLKPHLIALNNIKDFIDEVGLYIKDNETILSNRKKVTQHLECCKYLRHKICGHLDDVFCEMAKKWEPTALLKLPLSEHPEYERMWRVDMYTKALIESGINSFRKDKPSQLFFSDEIDIIYPPNRKQFMDFIGFTNETCIQLLSDIADHLEPNITFYDGLTDALEAIKEAAEMDFGVKNK